MADALVRLRVDSQEYDNKLKRATEQLQHMEKECRSIGGTFEYVEKETLDFVKALGDMETQTKSVRSQMREYQESILVLQQHYASLSDAEKAGDHGKAIMESLGKLKIRAAELKDQIGDLDQELKNMASDTQFTDGVGLMTSTIGSCAAAVTAWTGDCKELDQVIRELAKITTTVKAVESLTNAFQKQNLVLLKNPYVLAATAAAALAVAIGKVIKKSSELTAVEKNLQDVQKKGIDDSAKEVARIEALNRIIHDNTRSIEERRTALTELQALVPDYHGALTDEGTLINDNTSSLDAYISNLQRAATAQAAFDKMVELQKQKMNKQLELEDEQKNLEKLQSMAKAQPSVVTGGAGAINGVAAAGMANASNVAAAQRKVDDINAELDELDKQINSLQGMVSATDIATTTKGKSSKGGKNGGGAIVKPEEVLPAGSIAEIEKRISDLNNKLKMAGDQTTRDNIRLQIQALKDELGMMNEDLTSIDTNVIPLEVELAPTATEVLANEMDELRKRLGMDPIQIGVQVGTDGKSTVQTAKETEKAWGAAASAISAIGGALQSIEDPSAKVAGIVAQAIANIALTFSASLKGTFTPWDWIAAALSGTATMISTISAIKSVTQGFSEGGEVKGNSYSGDNIVARLNAGEGVLTQRGISTAAEMARGNGLGALSLRTEVSGTNLRIVLDNDNRKRGGSRGWYANTH